VPTLPVGPPEPSGSAAWVTGASLASDHRLDDVDLPADITLDNCAEGATRFLYMRSGQRFRIHNAVVRPNQAGCGCSIDACYGSAELDLPSPVVAGSVVITIDGLVLDPSTYRLYDGHLLVRTDGSYWPVCAHLSSPTGVDWSIAFTHGQSPPMDMILACRELAIHVAMALSGKVSKIPARAISVSRQGLSINLMRGMRSTGIPLVDEALQAENPYGLMGRGSFTSPDTIRLSST
jgi:hypothetical protein